MRRSSSKVLYLEEWNGGKNTHVGVKMVEHLHENVFMHREVYLRVNRAR